MDYAAWSGYASLPVLVKTEPAVRDLVYEGADAVAGRWLRAGAAGWRLDVMMDPSFADGFWQGFRAAVKATDPDAAIVGELWQRDQVLPKVRGDTADTTMNYRFRNAVTGYLGTIDREGFPDAGESDQPPSLLARKLLSTYEDYPAFAARTAWNLLDSHDTERILWSLAPGEPDERENAENLALAKARLRLASLLQFTLPGAPTIYYGDEIGMTGADDPDDRRTFPLLGADGALPAGADAALRDWYRELALVRRSAAVLRDGDLRFLVANDRDRTRCVLAVRRRGRPGDRGPQSRPRARGDDHDPDGRRARRRGSRPGRPGADGRRAGAGRGGDRAHRRRRPAQRHAAPARRGAPGARGGRGPGAARGADGSRRRAGRGQLRWDPVADAVRYRVERASFPDGPTAIVGWTGDTRLIDPAAPPMAAVYLVRAIDAAGNVGPAATLEVAPALPSAAPGSASPGATTPPGDEAPTGGLPPAAPFAARRGAGDRPCRGHDPGGPAALEAGLRGAILRRMSEPDATPAADPTPADGRRSRRRTSPGRRSSRGRAGRSSRRPGWPATPPRSPTGAPSVSTSAVPASRPPSWTSRPGSSSRPASARGRRSRRLPRQ